ncbi:phage tail tip lysozyme [Niallia taxi]|uniref:phage tail tip lysozyme n=1 Tax=Niallia taxi TaxID=2499688 RepID=UPI0015F461D1|nr:phage tail tip lysozyme [Niallia taxi]
MNSLKTIFARLTNNSAAISALDSVGISIKDVNDNLKPTQDILDELGAKWKSLSSETQQELLNGIGGIYQQNRLGALLNNYDIAKEASETAANSFSSSAQEQERYADSLTARLAVLQNKFTELAVSAGNAIISDSFITATSTLGDFLQTVTVVVEKVGFLPVVLGGAATAVALMSKNTRALAVALATGNVSALGLTGTTLGLQAGMTRAAMATTLLKTALRGLLISTGVGVALFAVGFALEKIINKFSEAKQAQQEFEEIQNTTVESLTTNKQKTDELLKSYQDLNAAKEKGTLTSDQEEEYLRVQQQLAILLPTLVHGYDSQNNAILKNGEALQQEIEYTKELVKKKKELQQIEAEGNIKSTIKSADKVLKEIDTKKSRLENDYAVNGKYLLDEEKKQIEIDITELKHQYAEKQMKIREELSKTAESYFTDITISTPITAKVNDIISDLEISDKSSSELNSFSEDIAKAMIKMQEALDDDNSEGFDKAEAKVNKLLGSFKNTEGDAVRLSLSFDDVKNSVNGLSGDVASANAVFDENGDAMEGSAEAAQELSDRIKEAQGDFAALRDIILERAKAGDIETATNLATVDSYQALSSEIEPLNGLLEDLANGKEISANQAMELIAKEKSLASMIDFSTGKVVINDEAVRKLRDSKVDGYAQMTKAVKAEALATANTLIDKLKGYKLEVEGIKNVAQAKAQLANLEKDQEIANSGMGSWDTRDAINETTDAIQDFIDISDSMDSLTDMASSGLQSVGTSAEEAAEKTKDATNTSTYVTDKYKQSLEKLNLALAQVQANKNKYADHSKKYQDAIKQEIKLIEQQIKLNEKQRSELNKQISSGNIVQTGKVTTSSTTPNIASTSSNYASGSSTEAAVWNFFKSKGFSDSATAGVMGNLRQESGLNTTARNPTSGATGIAQWLGGRLTGLKNFAGSQGTSWTNLNTQLEWLWKELNGADATTKSIINSNGGMSAFMNMSTADSALLFEKAFERSGGSALGNRTKFANQYYSKYAGSAPTGTASVSISDASSEAADKAQAVDQAKSEVLSLQQEQLQLEEQLGTLRMDLINSVVAGYDRTIASYEDDIAQIALVQSSVSETDKKWIDQQHQKESIYRKQIEQEKKASSYLKDQIKNNKALTEAQKALLEDNLLERTKEMISIEQQLLDERTSMADTIIDSFKKAAEAIKDAQVKIIDDTIDEINKKADEEAYSKQLKDAQTDRQSTLDEISKLSLDNSPAALAKLKELQEQLAEQDESISDMQTDRAREQRIDNLNEQKETVEENYNNLINDEQKFAKMRSDIISANSDLIEKDLTKYAVNIKANADVLGKAMSNNVIDLINQANRYMNGKEYKPIKIASAKEGGITPGWGNSGKLMMLHENEMISTEQETKDLLTAMSQSSMLADTLKSLDVGKTLANASMNLLTNFKMPTMPTLNTPVSTISSRYTYNINMNIDKVTGDQNGAKTLLKGIVNGVRSRGGNI